MSAPSTFTRRRALGLFAVATGAAVFPSVVRPLPSSAAVRPIVHGLATANLATLQAFETASGRFVRSHTYYRSWGGQVNLAWETSFATKLVERGTTPVITFQPRNPSLGVDQPAFAHRRIIAGDFDTLLRGWAAALRPVGGEVVMRFMHEGNGDWYPWCAPVNGNSAATYVAAWRHVRRVFDEAGATNVRWQWSMNKVYVGGVEIASLYPGDDVVDQVGFSGYNGGTVLDRGGWRSFGTIFERSIAEAQVLTPTPIHVAETSSATGSVGDRAAWISDMWAWLGSHPEVAGITWFDFDKGAVDWRLATSPETVRAYRNGAISVVPPRR